MFLRVIAVTTPLPLPHWQQVHVKNLIAKSFVPFVVLLLSPVLCFGALARVGMGPCRLPAHFLQQSEGWERNRNFGRAKKGSSEDASCGKGLLGSNVLPEGADLPALQRLRSSFPRGAEVERGKNHLKKLNCW